VANEGCTIAGNAKKALDSKTGEKVCIPKEKSCY
jgi:hypothetical protein